MNRQAPEILCNALLPWALATYSLLTAYSLISNDYSPQAPEIVWNVMGMMNNSYFRCKVHRTYHPTSGLPALRFQHPTLAGPGNFGGWFEENSNPNNPNPNPNPNPSLFFFSRCVRVGVRVWVWVWAWVWVWVRVRIFLPLELRAPRCSCYYTLLACLPALQVR